MASRDCALAACGRAERMAQAILLRRLYQQIVIKR
jgi:hypothetical protein